MATEQRSHWDRTYAEHPGMYGAEPSQPAIAAATAFERAGVREVLELGAGHGRDTLYFARRGFEVHAMDFSRTGLEQLRAVAGEHVRTTLHDVREPLPLPDGEIDAVFAHMLLCMALSTEQLRALMAEIRRVLRPSGLLVYTVRHTGDAHYGAGTDRGDDVYENGGFAVHFFSRELVEELAAGWVLDGVEPFEEGELPRRLWRVTQHRE